MSSQGQERAEIHPRKRLNSLLNSLLLSPNRPPLRPPLRPRVASSPANLHRSYLLDDFPPFSHRPFSNPASPLQLPIHSLQSPQQPHQLLMRTRLFPQLPHHPCLNSARVSRILHRFSGPFDQIPHTPNRTAAIPLTTHSWAPVIWSPPFKSSCPNSS